MPSPLASRRAPTRVDALAPRVDASRRRVARRGPTRSRRRASRVDRRASPRSGATGDAQPSSTSRRATASRDASDDATPRRRRCARGDDSTSRRTATRATTRRRVGARRRRMLRRRRRREWTRSPRRWARSTPSEAADTRRARGADERLTAIVDAYDDVAVEGAMRTLSGRDDAAAVAALARRRARCDEGAANARASDRDDGDDGKDAKDAGFAPTLDVGRQGVDEESGWGAMHHACALRRVWRRLSSAVEDVPKRGLGATARSTRAGGDRFDQRKADAGSGEETRDRGWRETKRRGRRLCARLEAGRIIAWGPGARRPSASPRAWRGR